MKLTKTFAFLAISSLALAACDNTGGSGGARDSVRVVGSSTVFPFAKKVGELFAQANPGFKAPLIESTGTGGGINLFCSGVGPSTPDIANASRRMKASEFEGCKANGVTDIIELQVGLDGLVFASAQGGIQLNLTPEIVYKAIAARPFGQEQTAQTWADVDPSLPAEPILVYGPPSTSGTRDSLKELILEVGCKTDPAMAALKESDEDEYDKVCTEVRSDGKYVDQGEQDNLIVQKISGNPKAVGIFGYSFLEENSSKVQGLPVNGAAPTMENVTSGNYPAAREMFIYVKQAHLEAIPGLKQFLAEWARNWGPDGALTRIGLIASPEAKRTAMEKAATEFTVMDGSELK
ncbi:substrate-binding domain-containing protein [Altererythrobacter sp. H2]|uniref:substrate-binding domain-containing protein n=1 Tax=Altererythrobacter sp. H2 TaxID=3108391 RepID=UPI002B4BF2D0|nr:substrate-binding domain-containing protein [Altererythrobacter sp. H2]WRK95668.1 substrate-binding domain-containing protein [Altererythrobacter sp. H2]